MPSGVRGNSPGEIARILAPVEFSERCAAAVRYAAALARYFASEVVLLHVIAPPPPGMSEESYARQAAAAEQKLAGFLSGELGDISPRRLVIKGDPARKIVQFAQDERADVILLSTRGSGRYRHFLLGSTAAKILHDAPCPVWTGVHMDEPPSRAFFPFRQILCAVDLGPQSEKALGWAAGLHRKTGAPLTILHSTPVVSAFTLSSENNWNLPLRAAAGKELERLRQQAGVTASLEVEAGDPAPAICAAARRLPADVVVIGRGSAAGAFGHLRANAYAIIRQSPCPVISV